MWPSRRDRGGRDPESAMLRGFPSADNPIDVGTDVMERVSSSGHGAGGP
jgi:hypothetical protein